MAVFGPEQGPARISSIRCLPGRSPSVSIPALGPHPDRDAFAYDVRVRSKRILDSGSSAPASRPVTPTLAAVSARLPRLSRLVLLGVIYILAGKLGLMLALVHPSATAVWPATGITLAALLLFGYGVWPAFFAGAFLVNLFTAGSVATSLGIASGNTLEGLVGAYLVNRFANGPQAFHRTMDTFRFALLAGLVSTTISATFGVTSLAAAGFAPWAEYGRIWLTWWLGDMGGCLVVAPVLILWGQSGRVRWDRPALLEAGTLLAVLTAVGLAAFSLLPPFHTGGYSLKFVCMPVLIWIAFRFDQRTAATATLLLSVMAVWGTVVGTWALGTEQRNESLQVLQVFLAVTAAATLVLASAVAERARAEARLRAISEDLREAMTELEAFSHSLSHDLRTPLGAVVNYAAALEQDTRGRLTAEQTDWLHGIQSSSRSVKGMLDQLVQFAWVEQQDGEAAEVDMTGLARAAYAEVAVGCEGAGSIQFELQDLPPTRGDGALLGRVFSNLLSNAVKYTRRLPERHITVTGDAGERENTYRVADNGSGFDPANSEILFQPFQRVATRPDVEGSGLGLAIVARIVRKHGGRVWAESDGSTGARFSFTLPNHRHGA
jgi:signal transduction histidine kinase